LLGEPTTTKFATNWLAACWGNAACWDLLGHTDADADTGADTNTNTNADTDTINLW
jgi:hypothetical protein